MGSMMKKRVILRYRSSQNRYETESLLAVRYDHVNMRDNDAGIPSSKLKDATPSPKAKIGKRKHKEGNLGLQDVFKSVIDMCRDDGKQKESKPADIAIKNQSLPVLYELIDQHNIHHKFLQDNDMRTPEEKPCLIGKIERVFDIITNRVDNDNNKHVCNNASNN